MCWNQNEQLTISIIASFSGEWLFLSDNITKTLSHPLIHPVCKARKPSFKHLSKSLV